MLYTVQEVAELLKTNVTYVYKLHQTGVLRCLKIGRLKVRKRTLEEFLAKYDGYDLTDPEHIQQLSTSTTEK